MKIYAINKYGKWQRLSIKKKQGERKKKKITKQRELIKSDKCHHSNGTQKRKLLFVF